MATAWSQRVLVSCFGRQDGSYPRICVVKAFAQAIHDNGNLRILNFGGQGLQPTSAERMRSRSRRVFRHGYIGHEEHQDPKRRHRRPSYDVYGKLVRFDFLRDRRRTLPLFMSVIHVTPARAEE